MSFRGAAAAAATALLLLSLLLLLPFLSPHLFRRR